MDNQTEILFTFGSTADAIAAEAALQNAGLAVRVMSLPSSIRAGCGLCLRVSPAHAKAAAQVLQNASIPAQDIYKRQATGAQSTYTPHHTEET